MKKKLILRHFRQKSVVGGGWWVVGGGWWVVVSNLKKMRIPICYSEQPRCFITILAS